MAIIFDSRKLKQAKLYRLGMILTLLSSTMPWILSTKEATYHRWTARYLFSLYSLFAFPDANFELLIDLNSDLAALENMGDGWGDDF